MIKFLSIFLIAGAMLTEVVVDGDNGFTMEGSLVDGASFGEDAADEGYGATLGGASMGGVSYGGAGFDGVNYGAANVRTQRVNIAPRIVNQRVMAKPRVITETEVQPVYQRIVNKPSILREKYVAVPQYVQSAP